MFKQNCKETFGDRLLNMRVCCFSPFYIMRNGTSLGFGKLVAQSKTSDDIRQDFGTMIWMFDHHFLTFNEPNVQIFLQKQNMQFFPPRIIDYIIDFIFHSKRESSVPVCLRLDYIVREGLRGGWERFMTQNMQLLSFTIV